VNEQQTAALMALADDYAREKQHEEDEPMAPHVDVHAAREKLAIALRQALEAPDGALIDEGAKPAQEPVAQVCDLEAGTDDDGQVIRYALIYPLQPLATGDKLYATPQPAPEAEIPAAVAESSEGRGDISIEGIMAQADEYFAMGTYGECWTEGQNEYEAQCAQAREKLDGLVRAMLAAAPKAPAASASEPVTWEEAEAALAIATSCGDIISTKEMQRALEGFAAGRAKGAAK